MAKNIVIKFGNNKISAVLNNSTTAEMIYKSLPIEGRVNLWGDEIYFTVPVMADLENDFAKELVQLGDLGYWPQGAAFCIFFGPTPISRLNEIKPASAVNIVGKVSGDYEKFKQAKDAETITIDKG